MKVVRLALAAAIVLPATVLVHELAHFTVALAFGFPDVLLYPTYVRDGAEAAGFPAWQRAVRAAAGPALTWVMIVAGVVAARGRPGSVWAVTLGLLAPVRSALVAAGLAVAAALGRHLAAANLDEVDAAMLIGVPAAPLLVASGVGSVIAWWLVVRALPAARRWRIVGAVAAGGAAGLGLYLAMAEALEQL